MEDRGQKNSKVKVESAIGSDGQAHLSWARAGRFLGRRKSKIKNQKAKLLFESAFDGFTWQKRRT
jgi:hypothetical protein